MLKIGGQKVPTPLIFLVATDCVLIATGILLATIVRFAVTDYQSIFSYLLSWETVFRFLLAILICVVALYFNDLYDFSLMRTRNEILVRLFQAFGVACLALALSYYIAPDLGFGRGIAALAAPVILTLTLGWRLLRLKQGHSLGASERILIMGTGPAGISIARFFVTRS